MPDVSLPTYDVRVSWPVRIPGLFTIGYSTLGGTDMLAEATVAAPFTGPYDDLSAKTLGFSYQAGRSDDLTEVVATSGTIDILDDEGVYNPHNQDSPLADELLPLRPYRIRATGPKLVPLTTNGWQIDDVARARLAESDDFEGALLRKRPLAYWRFAEAAGVVQYIDATEDPDNTAFPEGMPLTDATSLIAGDPGRAKNWSSRAFLRVLHGDNVNPRAELTLIVLCKPASVSASPYLLNKPNQYALYLEDSHVVFTYVSTTEVATYVKSAAALSPNVTYLIVVSFDGRRVRMWLNGGEVAVLVVEQL